MRTHLLQNELKTLFQEQAENGSQIIYTTHSPWIEQNKELRETLDQSKKQIETIKKYLTDSKANIASLKRLRDKLLAHTDKKQLSGNIWQDAGITIQNYRGLISAAHEIICICKLILDEPTPLLGMGIETDIDYLVYLLSKANDTLYDEKVF